MQKRRGRGVFAEIRRANKIWSQIYQRIFLVSPTEGEAVEHGSDVVKRAVADLTTSRYETSKHWADKYHIYFPHERDILNDMAYSNVLRLKFRMIQKLMEENLQQMKQSANEEDLEKYFTIHEQLKGAEKELANVLGIVVPK